MIVSMPLTIFAAMSIVIPVPVPIAVTIVSSGARVIIFSIAPPGSLFVIAATVLIVSVRAFASTIMPVAFVPSSVIGAVAALSLLLSFSSRIPVLVSISVFLSVFTVASSSIRLLAIKVPFVFLALFSLLLTLQLLLCEKLAGLFVPEQHRIVNLNLPFSAFGSLTPCAYLLRYSGVLFGTNPQ
jgi:hypothetical protein